MVKIQEENNWDVSQAPMHLGKISKCFAWDTVPAVFLPQAMRQSSNLVTRKGYVKRAIHHPGNDKMYMYSRHFS